MTDDQSHQKQLAAFFYRGPKGFYATPQALSWAMLKDQFFGQNDEGVFYRFMPQDPNGSEEKLEKASSKNIWTTQERQATAFSKLEKRLLD